MKCSSMISATLRALWHSMDAIEVIDGASSALVLVGRHRAGPCSAFRNGPVVNGGTFAGVAGGRGGVSTRDVPRVASPLRRGDRASRGRSLVMRGVRDGCVDTGLSGRMPAAPSSRASFSSRPSPAPHLMVTAVSTHGGAW